MYVKQVVLFGLFWLSCCTSSRIWRHNTSCERHGSGFTCLPRIGDRKTVIFECPSKARDYHIYINEFNGPSTLENLIIRNCRTLTILLRCTRYAQEKKNLKYLEISNIQTLRIQNTALYQPLLPPRVVFQNITRIENIPSHTFTQTNTKINQIRCVLPNYNFHSLHFRNVQIGTVQKNAVYMPNNFGNITFTDVRIDKLETSSFVVNHEHHGAFLFETSNVGVIKPAAIQILAGKAVFSNNKFVQISRMGIKIKSNVFNFVNNTIEEVSQPQWLKVESPHIVMSSNRFKILETGAFTGIGGSADRFGLYEFFGNQIGFLEDDGLLPNLNSYRNISAQVTFKENVFSCTCSQSGELLSKIGKRSNDSTTDDFYEKVFDERSENICFSPCNLPLHRAKAKIVEETCTNRVTVDTLCKAKIKAEVELASTTTKTSIFPFFPITASTPSNNKSRLSDTNEIKLVNGTTLALPTKGTVATIAPTQFLYAENSTSFSNSASSAKSLGSITNEQTFAYSKRHWAHISTVAPTKLLPVNYATSSISAKTVLSETSNENLLVSSTDKQELEIKKTSSAWRKYKTNVPTVVPTDALPRRKMATVLPIEGEIKSTNTNTFWKTSNSLPVLRITNKKLEVQMTTAALLKSRRNLTTASISATTLPSTKYKPAVSTENVEVFTSEHIDYRTTIREYKASMTTKNESTTSDKGFRVQTTDSSVKEIVGNCSKTHFMCSLLLIFYFSFVQIF